LIEVRDELFGQYREISRIELDLGMASAAVGGDLRGEAAFIGRPTAGVGDVERCDLGGHLGGDPGQIARVQAAGGDDADRDIGAQHPRHFVPNQAIQARAGASDIEVGDFAGVRRERSLRQGHRTGGSDF
jgi:hypothetical protein